MPWIHNCLVLKYNTIPTFSNVITREKKFTSVAVKDRCHDSWRSADCFISSSANWNTHLLSQNLLVGLLCFHATSKPHQSPIARPTFSAQTNRTTQVRCKSDLTHPTQKQAFHPSSHPPQRSLLFLCAEKELKALSHTILAVVNTHTHTTCWNPKTTVNRKWPFESRIPHDSEDKDAC